MQIDSHSNQYTPPAGVGFRFEADKGQVAVVLIDAAGNARGRFKIRRAAPLPSTLQTSQYVDLLV